MTPNPKLTESRVREKVRTIVYRTLGRAPASSEPRRRLVTEADVIELPFRGTFDMPAGALITPLARQVLTERQIRFGHPAAEARPAPGSGSGVGQSGTSRTASQASTGRAVAVRVITPASP
jgi:hypothetical protein